MCSHEHKTFPLSQSLTLFVSQTKSLFSFLYLPLLLHHPVELVLPRTSWSRSHCGHLVTWGRPRWCQLIADLCRSSDASSPFFPYTAASSSLWHVTLCSLTAGITVSLVLLTYFLTYLVSSPPSRILSFKRAVAFLYSLFTLSPVVPGMWWEPYGGGSEWGRLVWETPSAMVDRKHEEGLFQTPQDT